MPIGSEELHRRLQAIAYERHVVFYGEVADWVGLDLGSPYGRRRIGEVLGEVSEREFREGRPLLSAIVVSSDTMAPGAGFFELVKRLRLTQGDDREAFHVEELRRVHEYWSHGGVGGSPAQRA